MNVTIYIVGFFSGMLAEFIAVTALGRWLFRRKRHLWEEAADRARRKLES